MRLKVKEVREGLHPSEVLVLVHTLNGKEEQLLIDRTAVVSDWLDIGNPIAKKENSALVELPRETERGEWRVWVDLDQLDQVA